MTDNQLDQTASANLAGTRKNKVALTALDACPELGWFFRQGLTRRDYLLVDLSDCSEHLAAAVARENVLII